MNERILLVDPDESLLKKLGRKLKKTDYVVDTAGDGASALEAAVVSKPDLVITNYHLPIFDGERLRAFLRSNPTTYHIPFIYMVNADSERDTILASIGPDPTVIKPFKWGDINRKIIGVLRGGGSEEEEMERVGSGVEGHLQEVSLVDLLQIFSLNRRTGIVTLTFGEQTGVVYLKKGEVISAVHGDIKGEKALYRMLRWGEGKFQYQPLEFTVSRSISRSTEALLMEGMRQLDEWETLQSRMPEPETVLRLDKKQDELPGDLRPATQEVLLLLEFYQTVGDIVEKSAFTDYETCKSIIGLIQKGILVPISERRISKREDPRFIDADLALRIRKLVERTETPFGGMGLGKVLLFSSATDLLRSFLGEIGNLDEFKLSRDNFSNQEVLNASFGKLGSLEITDKTRIQLFVLPLSSSAQPMWKPFSEGALGAILLSDEDDGGRDALNLVREFVRNELKRPFVHRKMDPVNGVKVSSVDTLKQLFHHLIDRSGDIGDNAV